MKTNHVIALLLLTGLLVACSDDENPYKCKSCVDTPEALAANDNSGKGIYKGLVVGSSGNIKFNIANSGTTIDAILTIDGEEFELHTSAGYDIDFGMEGYFYGTKNTTDDIEIGFWVNGSGTDYGVFNVTIPGHSEVVIEIYKEFSTALVAVFEGEFGGDSEGTFNMMIRGEVWEVVAKNDDDFYDHFEGTLDGDNLDCNCGDVQITGKVNGDKVNGEWSVLGTTEDGTWEGFRRL